MAMRFETSQSMRMGQHMKLAPRVIQTMEILQMPLAELEERIEQELESNITLEMVEPGDQQSAEGADPGALSSEASGDASGEVDTHAGENAEDFERLDEFERDNPEFADNAYEGARERPEPDRPIERTRSRLEGEPDAKAEAMAATPARHASLQEQLREQWRLSDVDPVLIPIGEAIIGELDDDGFLRTPLAEIATRLAPPGTETTLPDDAGMERALQALQLFLDPPGIAARDLRESLLLQLDSIESEGPPVSGDAEAAMHTARVLIESHLDDLSQNRLPRIAESTGLSMDDLKRGIERLRGLSLAPARALIAVEHAAVTPDAVVEYDEEQDRYIAYLNDRSLPQVRINREYAKMTRDRSLEKRDRDFVRTNLSNAQWLIDAVEQRKATLLRVVRAVVDAQREYFDYGPQNLRPLPMTGVAEQLGIHVATVSRAVAEKHIETPRGVVPLRSFFSGGMQTESGDEMSYDAIKAALKDVIDEEDKAKPLSDEALVKALKEKGIEIARRTVAKYRSQLDIPSARLRKKF